MKLLLMNPYFREGESFKTEGAFGRKLVLEKYGWQRVVNVFEKILKHEV